MATVLVVYGSSHGQTALIARHIAARMRTHGVEVVLYDVAALPRTLEVGRYDAALVGARVHGRRFPRRIAQFVRDNLTALQGIPSAFFSVSMAAAKPATQPQAEADIRKFLGQTGWRPRAAVAFAGALMYTKYTFLLRFVMKRIAAREGNATATSRDVEYTDWDAVRRFADAVALAVEPQVHREPAAHPAA